MKSNVGICKFCGQQCQLVQSHTLPKSMQLQNKCEKLQMMKSDSNFIDIVHYQNGHTENNILCKECDNFMGKYDKFAKEFLSQDFSKYTVIFDPYKMYIIPLSLDQYTKLKKFFASVILRISLPKNLLGDKYTQKFIQYLKSLTNDIKELEIIVKKIINPIPNFNVIFSKSRFGERWCYLFQSFGYELICKVDSQVWSKDLDCFLLKDNIIPILLINRLETVGYNVAYNKFIDVANHCSHPK